MAALGGGSQSSEGKIQPVTFQTIQEGTITIANT